MIRAFLILALGALLIYGCSALRQAEGDAQKAHTDITAADSAIKATAPAFAAAKADVAAVKARVVRAEYDLTAIFHPAHPNPRRDALLVLCGLLGGLVVAKVLR